MNNFRTWFADVGCLMLFKLYSVRWRKCLGASLLKLSLLHTNFVSHSPDITKLIKFQLRCKFINTNGSHPCFHLQYMLFSQIYTITLNKLLEHITPSLFALDVFSNISLTLKTVKISSNVKILWIRTEILWIDLDLFTWPILVPFVLLAWWLRYTVVFHKFGRSSNQSFK